MSACPEIEMLTSATGRGLVGAHLERCEACAAVATLAELRSERKEGHDDSCAQAEVAIALWHSGLLGAGEQAELVQHLESCGSCNEAAVRLRALPRFDDEVTVDGVVPARTPEAPEERRRRRALGWALAAAALVALAFGAGSLVRRRAASDGLAPSPLPTLGPAGGALSVPSVQAPSVAPVLSAPAPDELIDPWARPPRGTPKAEPKPSPRGGDVLDPWSAKAPLAPEPVPSSLPKPSAQRGNALEDPWAPSVSVGFFTLVCEPSCDKVSVSGKDLGPSPIVRAPLAAGVHAVVLQNGSTKRSLSVEITAKQTTVLRVSMTSPRGDLGY